MAPNLATAEATYSQAVKKLKVACTFLEGQLSPPEPGEVIDIPTDRPETRANIAQTCRYCEQELEQIEPDQRVDHECTHQEQLNQEAAASRQAAAEAIIRASQPNGRVIQRYLDDIDSKMETFTTALCTLSSLMEDEEQSYSDHLMVWARYCGWMKNRAYALLDLIETGNRETGVGQILPRSTDQPGTSTQKTPSIGQLVSSLQEVLVSRSASTTTQPGAVFQFGQPANTCTSRQTGFNFGHAAQTPGGSVSEALVPSVQSTNGLNASAVAFNPVTNMVYTQVGRPQPSAQEAVTSQPLSIPIVSTSVATGHAANGEL